MIGFGYWAYVTFLITELLDWEVVFKVWLVTEWETIVSFFVSFFFVTFGKATGYEIFTLITIGALGYFAYASASWSIFNNLCCSSLYNS